MKRVLLPGNSIRMGVPANDPFEAVLSFSENAYAAAVRDQSEDCYELAKAAACAVKKHIE